MRGLPGSGKTALARDIAARRKATIVSADDFFTDEFGDYNYNAACLDQAHIFAKNQMLTAIAENQETIIIDNMNIRIIDMLRYGISVPKLTYEVTFHSLSPNTSWCWDSEICFKKCIHRVPLTIIERLKQAFQPIPDASLDTLVKIVRKNRDEFSYFIK